MLWSEEVGHQSPIILALCAFGDGLKDDEVSVGVLVQTQQGSLVVHAVAVVGGGPERDQLFVEPVDVPLLHQLVGSHDQRQIVQQVEVIHHLVSEYPARTSWVPAPGFDVLRVGPHQISQRTLVGYFLLTIQETHLVDGGQIGWQASMHAEQVAIDDGSQWEEVKGLIEILPAIWISVFLVDLIQEAIHHRDVPALVVAPQQVHPLGVLHLQAEQQSDRLHWVIPSVHEISDEDVLVIGNASTLRDQVFDIEELTVDVSGYVNRRVHAHNVRLFCQHSLHQIAKGAHRWFRYGLTSQRRLVPLLNAHTNITTQ